MGKLSIARLGGKSVPCFRRLLVKEPTKVTLRTNHLYFLIVGMQIELSSASIFFYYRC